MAGSAWQIQGARGGIFRPHVPGDGVMSDASSEYFGPAPQNEESLLRVVVSDLTHEIERDGNAEQERIRERERASASAPTTASALVTSSIPVTTSSSMRPSLVRGTSYGSITGGATYTASANQARQEARGGGSGTPGGKKLTWNDAGPVV